MSLRARSETKDEVVTTRLDAEMVERLRELAKQHERTVAAEVRLAVRKYLEGIDEEATREDVPA
jgi:predicted DNA-binding protein